MPKKLTLEEVQAFIDEYDINDDCILLSTEYKNVSTPLTFYCNNCGKIFTKDFNHLKTRKVFCCPECSRKRAGKKNSLGIEYIKDFIEKNDTEHQCTLLSTEYKNSATPLDFICNVCGEKFQRDWAHIKRMRFRCPACGIHAGATHKKYSKEDVIAEIGKKGYTITGEYVDAATPFQVKCKEGHDTTLRFTYFLKGQSGCMECYKLYHRGPNHPLWKGGPSEVKEYIRKNIRAWKRQVLIKDNFQCILTKERTHSLVVHHLKSFNTILNEASQNTGIPVLQKLADYENEEYIQLTNEVIRLHDVNNGVTLTKEIHDLFHEIYGRGDNTPEQFKEFTRRFQAGEFEVKHNE